jgi:hypothetical protein
MNTAIMTVKENIELIGSLIIGGGTTAFSLKIEEFMETSTPYLKYYGLVVGILLSTVLFIHWTKKTFFDKKKSSKL